MAVSIRDRRRAGCRVPAHAGGRLNPTIGPVTIRESRIGFEEWPAALSDADGRQVVVAGPGTGKTEFLVRRVAHLVQSDQARRDEIVVLCFSRRAAGSLRTRVDELVGSTGTPITVTTFHSLALSIAEAVGGGDVPMVLTTPEQVEFVASTLAQEDPSSWPLSYRGILRSRPFAAEVADFLMRCSERLLDPEDLEGLTATRADWKGMPAFYRRYLERLAVEKRTDYGVLLAETVKTLAEGRAGAIIGRYRYVLVDEYQDTTPAQAKMAELLSQTHGNLTVAGDPYQSIYSFRGADLTNIASFGAGGARRIVLGESLRVPSEIMEAALRIVTGADLPGGAGPVEPARHPGRAEAYVFDQQTAEAEWIAEQVEHAVVVDGVEPSRIAVLVRTKRELLTELSRALDRRRIPHDPPVTRLVDHPAVGLIRDVVTVAVHGGSLPATTANQAAAADRAMRRILLGPVIGIELGRERVLLRARRRTWEPWHRVVAERLPDRPGLATLTADAAWATDGAAIDGFWHLWETLDGIDEIVADTERAEWRQAWHSFAQTLGRQAERDPSVSLERYFALTDDEDFEAEPMLPARLPENRVTLTTLHQAKGLEFDVVFIANATEGVFPDLRRARRMLRPELLAPERLTDPRAQVVFQLQEEVRLAYTAMTRARSRVVWTATSSGGDLGERRPSRFLVAAAGRPLEELGPPDDVHRDPITIAEAETELRRRLLDPAEPAASRLAAAGVLARHRGRWWDPERFAGVAEAGPDQPILRDRLHLSPSQAESYQECPRKYAMERRLRLGGPTNEYAESGSLVHTVLERAESEIVGTGARHADKGRALEILEEVWTERAEFGSPGLNNAWKRRAAKIVENLYDHWPGDGEPIETERRVTADIGGIEWIGYIDRVERIDGGLRVIDFKTSSSAPTQEDAARSIQLAFYALARSTPAEPVIQAQLWYPKVKMGTVTVRHLDISSIDEVRRQMTAITESIKAEEWEPRLGPRCDKCEFRVVCPLWPDGRGAYLP